MQTQLAPIFQGTADGMAAQAILRKCVHCGFCNATCPTYQLLGNELDGPRGRIYLIKGVLEGNAPTQATQQHLDRCLTCRNCETTCPSGVQYSHLLDIGRKLVDERVPRNTSERALRWALKEGLPSPLFAPALALGRAVRGVLPQALQAKIPNVPSSTNTNTNTSANTSAWPTRTHARKVVLLEGCVQPALAPNINPATARVLAAAGIQTLRVPQAGCCGAVRFHLNDQDGARTQMRANIDAWWPLIASEQAEALVMNASGCGVTVKEYGHILRDDPAYADKAARISTLTRDLSEWLPELTRTLLGKLNPSTVRLAYHPPCTLQHGQQLRGGVETHLGALGFNVQIARTEAHLCCGSAGTYSVLQPTLANTLRDRKLAHLQTLQPDTIISANVGCITHLQSATSVPVKHWVEVLDAALTANAVPKTM